MSEAIAVNTDALKKAGDRMSVLQASVDSIVKKLDDAVGSVGASAWGKDAFGAEFANGESGYIVSRRSLLKGGRDISATISSFGSGMREGVKNLRNAETDTAEKF